MWDRFPFCVQRGLKVMARKVGTSVLAHPCLYILIDPSFVLCSCQSHQRQLLIHFYAADQEPTKLSPVAWAGLVAILLVVSLAVTSKQATSAFQWQGWRRQLRDDAQHHALMEQQDAERFTPAQLAQLNKLRARFLQEGGLSTGPWRVRHCTCPASGSAVAPHACHGLVWLLHSLTRQRIIPCLPSDLKALTSMSIHIGQLSFWQYSCAPVKVPSFV